MHLKLEPLLFLQQDDRQVDLGELADILAGIAETGTVRGAAERMEQSYRGIWGKISNAEGILSRSLVIKAKGHGSSLTAAGKEVLRLAGEMRQRARAVTEREVSGFERQLRELLALEQPRLRMTCSHDILLQHSATEGRLPFLEMRFMGSTKALLAMESGKADLAGFHLPENMPVPLELGHVFADPRLFVVPLMRREQGLLVARGNPKGITGVADLARQDIRFINRQRGAGTRIWLDQLLESQGVDPRAIKGYDQEEFTHFAVAAAVAAGAADVAFAVRAAAEGFSLDFIPVGRETYYLCGRVFLKGTETLDRIVAEVGRGLPLHAGYSLPPARAAD